MTIRSKVGKGCWEAGFRVSEGFGLSKPSRPERRLCHGERASGGNLIREETCVRATQMLDPIPTSNCMRRLLQPHRSILHPRSENHPPQNRHGREKRAQRRRFLPHLTERPRQRTSRAVTRYVLLGARQVRMCDAARPVRAQRNMSGEENQEAQSGTLGGLIRRSTMTSCVLRSVEKHMETRAQSEVPCGYV